MHYSTIYLSPKIIMLMRRELSIARRLFLAGLERRVDKFDNPPQPEGHSKIEFLDYYGELTQWNESAVVARDDAQDQEAALKVSIPWHKFLAIINAKLKDPSARSLLETTVSLRRDEPSACPKSPSESNSLSGSKLMSHVLCSDELRQN